MKRLIDRRRMAFGATLALILTQSPIGVRATVTGAPIEIPVITSTTGQLSFLGKEQERALSVLETVLNKQQDGINGRPVKFVVHDDTSNPLVALQLATKIIADAKTPIFIGPQTTSGCNAVSPLLTHGPVMYCLTPGYAPAPNSFGFSGNTGTDDDTAAIIRYFRLKGWTRIAILTTTDAAGQVVDRGFARALALPENKTMQVVAYEHAGVADITVAGQMAKIQAAKPQAIANWSVGTPFATFLRGVQDTGIDVPIASSTGNMTYAQMADYTGFMPKLVLFPGLRPLTRNGTGKGPVFDAQKLYFGAFSAIGGRPDYADDLIWDPALLVVDTLRHIGANGTADDARRYLIALHGFFGINGLYDFRDGSQRGIGINAVIIDRWDTHLNDFVAVSKPAGYPL